MHIRVCPAQSRFRHEPNAWSGAVKRRNSQVFPQVRTPAAGHPGPERVYPIRPPALLKPPPEFRMNCHAIPQGLHRKRHPPVGRGPQPPLGLFEPEPLHPDQFVGL